MANQEYVDLLKRGVTRWNAWYKQNLKKAHGVKPDLSNADLSFAKLNGVELSFADLSFAKLNGAELRLANLSSAKLIGAELRGTDLLGSNLNHTDLSNADLSGAILSGANINQTILRGAILSHTRVTQTIFAYVDLRETEGLVEIHHATPSLVYFHTVQLPQDGSAIHFLRGTGIPDEWINDYCVHMMHPIQYHSLFISYSSIDNTLARRLHADLQANGVRCWFAPEDMKIGDKIRPRIDEAIHLQDKLLLLLSEHSIASIWMENEVEAALEKEDRQGHEVLFPVRLDDVVMQTSRAWAATLRRTRHIGDFTNWAEPQAYQQAFDRLLRDLKKADEPQDQEMKQ